MTAITSIGATVAAWSHENHPNEAPTAPPNATCGNRAVPPATGYMAPSSAWTSASIRIAIAPMTHEMIAAGPAVASAPCAPNSQPEPMIEPPEAHRRPMNPISRRSPGCRGADGRTGASMAAMAATVGGTSQMPLKARLAAREPRVAIVLALVDAPAADLEHPVGDALEEV